VCLPVVFFCFVLHAFTPAVPGLETGTTLVWVSQVRKRWAHPPPAAIMQIPYADLPRLSSGKKGRKRKESNHIRERAVHKEYS
jgi:hypothetical protein